MKKAFIIIGVFLAVFAAYFVLKGAEFYKGIYKKNTLNPLKITPKKTAFNILMLGYGGPGHDGPYLTDSIMIAHVDIEKNKVALISLPRDLWIKMPTKSGADFHAKINAIYQLGLFPTEFPDVDTKKYPETSLMKKALSDVTGLDVDYYVTIDFTGFTKAIDILGGVIVDVKTAFDDYEYPLDGKENELCGRDEDFAKIEKFIKPPFNEDEKKEALKDKPDLEKFLKDITEDPKEAFPCRYEHLHFDAGRVFMNGETALKYVRSRHSLQDGTDFGRAARQQEFVKSVKERVMNVGILTKVVPLLDEMKKHIQTDIPANELQKWVSEAKDAGKYRMINIRMSDTDYLQSSFSDYGGYILIPRKGEDRWGDIHTMIQNGIDEITPTPSPAPITVSPTRAPISPTRTIQP